MRHFTAPLFRYCLGQVAGDRALAEDMVQETFLRTYRALMNGRPDDVGAFLFGVARNCCAEARRKSAPREAAPRTEPSSDVDLALDGLDESERSLIHLKHVEGRTCAEIAAILGKPVGTVTSSLARAYAKLRGRLER